MKWLLRMAQNGNYDFKNEFNIINMVTVKEYQTVINTLSDKHKEILKNLYYNAPFRDTNTIANVLKYKNFGAANLHIGTIGKKIAKHLNLEIEETYNHPTGIKMSYYTVVHDHFENGWELQENLKTAIENLGWIKNKAQKAYIFVWNPKTWLWDNIEENIKEWEEFGATTINWKCGNTKSISIGDRIFLVKLGTKPKGIIASGYALTEPRLNEDDGGLYIDIELEVLFNPEIDDIYPIEDLQIGNLAKQGSWTPQASGISIKPEVIEELEEKWADFLTKQGIVYIPSTIPKERYTEGTVTQILQNRYERDPKARQACIGHYGLSCAVCEFNFEEKYGDIGKDFIHVHHLIQISTRKEVYVIDPINDLIPVCPNCHSMLHKRNPPFTIEELRELMK